MTAQQITIIIDDLLNDRISAKQSWIELCNSIEKVDVSILNDFIYKMEVDPGLHNIVRFCEDRNIQILVLSDGFDYYIDMILTREKLNGLKYFSNHLIISPQNKLIPDFPYYDPLCQYSANCKRNHKKKNSRDEVFIIYMGEGKILVPTVIYYM